MSQKLHRRAVAALGELYLLTGLHSLQDISLEQLEQAQWTRSGILIACYLYQSKLLLERLELELREIRQLPLSPNIQVEVRYEGL
jgi:hypothetical protein